MLAELNIKGVAERCQATSVAKGFVETPVNVDQKLLLAVGELVEAQNELRDGHAPTEIYFPEGSLKPEGFPIELADAVIRILQLAESLGIDIMKAMELKMDYNDTRPFKHGKQF